MRHLSSLDVRACVYAYGELIDFSLIKSAPIR